MNNHHDTKYHHSSTTCGAHLEGSIHEIGSQTIAGGIGPMEYDETALLSKMFTKDHLQNRSGFLHHITEQPSSNN